MKTYSAKPSEVTRAWHLIDAKDAPLGRIATQVATLLTGKHKPMFTPHIDCGDFVVIINASELVVTGDKLEKKKYYHYSGYPGGIKEAQLKEKLGKDAASVIENAVRGMIPANKLRPERLKRLKVYVGGEHNHAAQKPKPYSVKEGK